ncbi:MAG TPA: hypothetical protein VKW09_05235 [bacterium]|nr:hypothetical protein [bacterium]
MNRFTALTDIAAGSATFIAANIFIYHFAGSSEECSSFLARIKHGDLRGSIGPIVLLEVAAGICG